MRFSSANQSGLLVLSNKSKPCAVRPHFDETNVDFQVILGIKRSIRKLTVAKTKVQRKKRKEMESQVQLLKQKTPLPQIKSRTQDQITRQMMPM